MHAVCDTPTRLRFKCGRCPTDAHFGAMVCSKPSKTGGVLSCHLSLLSAVPGEETDWKNAPHQQASRMHWRFRFPSCSRHSTFSFPALQAGCLQLSWIPPRPNLCSTPCRRSRRRICSVKTWTKSALHLWQPSESHASAQPPKSHATRAYHRSPDFRVSAAINLLEEVVERLLALGLVFGQFVDDLVPILRLATLRL